MGHNNLEDKERAKIINEAIERFLEENDLALSKDNKARVRKHIATLFRSESSVSTSMIHDHLQEAFEYQEYNRMNIEQTDDAEAAEEALTVLLLSTNTRPNRKAAWFLLTLCLVAALFVFYTLQPNTQPITVAQSDSLKAMVSKIVDLEQQNGNKTTHIAVWNTIKESPEIKGLGYKKSYKDFTQEQYQEAAKLLEAWKKDVHHSLEQSSQDGVFNFKASEITVVDGDTFHAKGMKFRLWGVDAFEKKQSCFDQAGIEYKCGVNSTNVLQNIIKEAGTLACKETTKDRYARIVAACDVNGAALGAKLVEAGYHLDYTQYSGGAFKAEEDLARENKKGAWNGCFTRPWDWRRKVRTTICE